MEAHRTGQRWTWAEFARLPSDDAKRREIIAGELVVTPAPRRAHQRVVTDVAIALGSLVRAHDLGELYAGPVDVLFAEGDYLEPDLVFVRKGRDDVLTDRGVEGPPDLVVEVTSPSTEDRDRGVKLERYRHYGVVEYWVVDPDARRIEVWRLADGAEQPVTLGAEDVLVWAPVPDGPVLEAPVGDVVRKA